MREGASESTSDREASVKVNTLWLLRQDIGKSYSSHCSGSGSGSGGGVW